MLLIAVSQIIIYAGYITPIFAGYSINTVLQGMDIYLFVLVTATLAAGSYVINDIKDHQTDLINKPENTYIGVGKLSVRSAYIYYWILTVIGGLVAAYIALHIGKPYLFSIYPSAVALLYMYSHILKRMPLSGNIVVAVFCAFVPGIIWYAESDGMSILAVADPALVYLYLGYMVFGFLATMVREIVKDIEDKEGDESAGYNTLPIAIGVAKSKSLAIVFCLALLLSYVLWYYATLSKGWTVMSIVITITMVAPSAYILQQIYVANAKPDYSKVSRMLKYLIAISLFVFVGILLPL